MHCPKATAQAKTMIMKKGAHSSWHKTGAIAVGLSAAAAKKRRVTIMPLLQSVI